MFYIKECYFRLLYLLYMLINILIILFINKKLILLLFSFSILEKFMDLNKNLFETIVYNSPIELLMTYLSLFLYYSLFVGFPYIFWGVYDFLKSTLFFSKIKLIKFIFIFCYLILVILILFSFFIFLPHLWFFLKKINTLLEYSTFFNFYSQLQFNQYFLFLKTFFNTIIYCYIFIVFIVFFSFIFKLNFLLYIRKILVFINMFLATILSPPDIFSQLFFFFLLLLITEFISYFYILLIKYKKFKHFKLEKN
jgi:sec-independent protein translocase protein TatC